MTDQEKFLKYLSEFQDDLHRLVSKGRKAFNVTNSGDNYIVALNDSYQSTSYSNLPVYSQHTYILIIFHNFQIKVLTR